ncbi:hypothetical protein [Lysinibacillus sp. BW-2-10]|uniref:hypothetical protein n=1 Tax=Lysinibacillus sp. BW-2-10 TaxID=2590030 RepID=UPI00117E9F04|nr:hypothetical protein [Lysinibacillus sp. BW-2-10]TSI05282.1 hypothetical protein FJQ64_13325 [Lysinibacillus sp. BW-2-10]
MIGNRNPEYKEKTNPSLNFGEGLLTKDLIAIDIFVNGERIRVKKKQKFVVQFSNDYWWIDGNSEFSLNDDSVVAELFSVNDIDINNGEAYVTFSYHNGPPLTIGESEIFKLINVRKKARREDEDIKELIEGLLEHRNLDDSKAPITME